MSAERFEAALREIGDMSFWAAGPAVDIARRALAIQRCTYCGSMAGDCQVSKRGCCPDCSNRTHGGAA